MKHSRLLHAPALLVASLLLAVTPSVRAGDPEPLVYGLNETGTLSVNGTQLDKLPSSFKPDTNENSFQKWTQLAVVDNLATEVADRFAMRLDGLLYRNGAKLYTLPFVAFPSGIPQWVGLSVANSSVYALRQDGLLSTDGTDTVIYSPGLYYFTTCLAVEGNVYSLRTDGSVFRNLQATAPYLKFTGPPGLNVIQPGVSGESGKADGQGSETVWVGLAWNELSGQLWGLRRDGVLSTGILVGQILPPDEQIFQLPFPTNPLFVDQNDDRYRRMAFTADGTFHVLRGNGQIYTDASLLTPLVDLPAGGSDPIDDTYLDIAAEGESFWSIRWDGNVYRDTDTSPLLSLTSNRYTSVELSLLPPDLTNFKNPKPLLETYTVTVVEGGAVSVPVYATDIELPPSELLVTLQDPLKKPLPPGLEFVADGDMDPLTPPRIEWDVATPKGTYTVPMVVSDSVNKPKTYNYKVKVILPDTNPLKNKPPVFTKVKNTQALVNSDYSLEMFAVDPDEGDTVTLSVDLTKEPFATLGAQFLADPGTGTGTFLWSPTFDNIGKQKVKFIATDSLDKQKTYSITVKVVNSLIFTAPF